MALSRGAKIALGCGIAFVLAVGGTVATMFGVAWWGFGKAKQVAEQFEGDQKRAEEALKKANANPFSAPADGVIQEDRLLRFLAVRKGMYNVYAKHKDMIEAQAKKQNPDLSALARLPGIMIELRAAKAEALAEQGMSAKEFDWLFGTVYRNLVVAGIVQEGGGERVSEVVQSAGETMAEQSEKAATAAEGDPNMPPDLKQQLRAAADRIREQADGGAEYSRTLDIPPANMALFKKHRHEILRYTMGGLELLPL